MDRSSLSGAVLRSAGNAAVSMMGEVREVSTLAQENAAEPAAADHRHCFAGSARRAWYFSFMRGQPHKPAADCRSQAYVRNLALAEVEMKARRT